MRISLVLLLLALALPVATALARPGTAPPVPATALSSPVAAALAVGEPSAAAAASAAAAMLAAGEPYASWARAGRRFLAFDTGGTGIGVEVIGDLASADRIAVLVPGVDTKLRDFDRGHGGVARRAPGVQARAIHARLRAADPGARVAVVAWLGYQPPKGMTLDVARDLRARAGAPALVDFVRGLPSRAAVTLIGHSYGALVVGLAAPHLPRVADVVALGAPGMGADTAAELGGAHVWAALAADDWIHRVPQIRLLHLGHGRRPSTPEFGATPLPTAGVAGHDGYLCPGSTTLDSVATIVLGHAVVGLP